jgi:hypothetical protein
MQKQKIFTTLLNKPYLFRRIITLSIEEFNLLSEKLDPEWKQNEFERLSARKDRKNKVGQGRKYELGKFSNLLLATLFYLRTNIGYELLSLVFNVDQSTIKRVVRRVIPLLTDRFIPKTEITKKKRRTNNLDELLGQYPELTDVIIDGTELSIKRPRKRQKQSYSGKKKRHTKKTQVAQDKNTKLIIGLSPPKKGKIHDKKQVEQVGWNDKLPDDINCQGDLGFQGMNNWIIPHKKPKGKELTKKQKRQNKKMARERITVEHAIRGMKIFRRIGETVSIKSDDFLFNVLLASANLYNFKRLVRQGIS